MITDRPNLQASLPWISLVKDSGPEPSLFLSVTKPQEIALRD
jgi:hypothetical protein